MPVRVSHPVCRVTLLFVMVGKLAGAASAQEVLPEIVVELQRPAPPRPAATRRRSRQNAKLAGTDTKFDVARDNLSPRFGASTFDMNRAFIDTLPQGTNGPINSVLLQAPGVAADSAVNGDIHVRNEHANVHTGSTASFCRTAFPASAMCSTRVLSAPRADHRRAAGTVRPAHRRHRRHPDPERQFAATGRQCRRLWRQFWHSDAELRLWRPQRNTEYFCHRPRLHQQSRHRKPDRQLQCDPRPHLSGQLLQLHFDGARPEHAREHDLRQHHQPIPNSKQSRTNAGVYRFRRQQFRLVDAQRAPGRAKYFRRLGIAEIRQWLRPIN